MLTSIIVSAIVLQGGGLQIKDTVAGRGKPAKAGDVLTMEYTGTLKSGKVFDSSKGKAPFAFKLGAGQVIKGWDQGLVGMKVGGKRKLVIPASLGYGDRDLGDIPPNSTLIFDVKLLRIDAEKATPKVEIKDIKKGTGAAVKPGDSVKVHYRGKFINGFQFDASYDRNEPLPVAVGAGQVIKGFDQGLTGMRVGGKRKVIIPYSLAYGAQGRPPVIPQMSTLVFELELVSIG